MARSLYERVTRLLREPSTRSLQQLDSEVTALASSLSSLSATTKRLSSRYGMQDVRARRKEESAPLNGATMSKAELRAALQSGELHIIRDP